jgi:hypothetical protein
MAFLCQMETRLARNELTAPLSPGVRPAKAGTAETVKNGGLRVSMHVLVTKGLALWQLQHRLFVGTSWGQIMHPRNDRSTSLSTCSPYLEEGAVFEALPFTAHTRQAHCATVLDSSPQSGHDHWTSHSDWCCKCLVSLVSSHCCPLKKRLDFFFGKAHGSCRDEAASHAHLADQEGPRKRCRQRPRARLR